MNAVDSEFKKNLSNESRARTQIEKHHAVLPGSILNRFSTGNLESLKVPGIMDELRKFYNANYSSNLMSLVLVGRQNVDELQKYAETYFSEIQNKDYPVRDFSNEVCFDKEHTFGKIFKIVPAK
jgi:insulysin